MIVAQTSSKLPDPISGAASGSTGSDSGFTEVLSLFASPDATQTEMPEKLLDKEKAPRREHAGSDTAEPLCALGAALAMACSPTLTAVAASQAGGTTVGGDSSSSNVAAEQMPAVEAVASTGQSAASSGGSGATVVLPAGLPLVPPGDTTVPEATEQRPPDAQKAKAAAAAPVPQPDHTDELKPELAVPAAAQVPDVARASDIAMGKDDGVPGRRAALSGRTAAAEALPSGPAGNATAMPGFGSLRAATGQPVQIERPVQGIETKQAPPPDSSPGPVRQTAGHGLVSVAASDPRGTDGVAPGAATMPTRIQPPAEAPVSQRMGAEMPETPAAVGETRADAAVGKTGLASGATAEDRGWSDAAGTLAGVRGATSGRSDPSPAIGTVGAEPAVQQDVTGTAPRDPRIAAQEAGDRAPSRHDGDRIAMRDGAVNAPTSTTVARADGSAPQAVLAGQLAAVNGTVAKTDSAPGKDADAQELTLPVRPEQPDPGRAAAVSVRGVADGPEVQPVAKAAEKNAGGVVAHLAERPEDGGATAVDRAALSVGPIAESRAVAQSAPTHQQAAPAATPMAQLARHAAAQPAAHHLELQLSPAELGPVRMTFSGAEGGALAVTIHAGRADTLDLLRSNIHVLSQEFRDIGFSNATFTFGQWSQSAQPGRSETEPESERDDPDIPAVERAPALLETRLAAAAPRGGLDLRV